MLQGFPQLWKLNADLENIKVTRILLEDVVLLNDFEVGEVDSKQPVPDELVALDIRVVRIEFDQKLWNSVEIVEL